MVIISKVYANLNCIDHLNLVRLEGPSSHGSQPFMITSIIVPLAPKTGVCVTPNTILAYSSSKQTNKQTVDLITSN